MCLSIAIDRPENVLAKGEHLGFQWVVVHNGTGYCCGYVRVPLGHPWHGKGYWDLNVEVHGGVSFGEADVPCDNPGADIDWWIGFDCNHAFDAPDPELVLVLPNQAFRVRKAEVRTQLYTENECRLLCQQAASASSTHQ